MPEDNRVVLHIVLDSAKAERGLRNMLGSLGNLNTVAGKLSATLAAVFSIHTIRNFINESKEAWNVQLQAETKLETILGRNLHAAKAQIQAAKDWASELQKVGVIGDEIQLSGLQELSTYIENADSLKTMNVVLNDMLAQQYGLNATAESAVTISTMLGKVLEGQTAALSRYGYSFTEAQEKLLKYGTEEQRVATLAEVVESAVGGVNEALAKTPAGQMKQLSNYMGDIKEKFGQAATNIQTLFLPVLNRMADTLDAIAQKAIDISEIFGSWLGVDLSRNIASGTAAADALTESLTAAQEAAEALGSASFDDFNIIGKNDADSEESATTDVPSLGAASILDSAENVRDKVSYLLGGIDFSDLIQSFDNLKSALEPFKEKAGEGLKWLHDEVLKPLGKWTFEKAAPAVLDVFSAALDGLDTSIEALKPYGKWLWEDFISPLASWTGEIIVSGLEGLADVLHNVGDWIRDNPDAAVYIGGLSAAFVGLSTAVGGGAFASAAGAIGRFITKVGAFNVTVGIIAAGIVGWGYAITEVSKNWDDICQAFNDSGGAFEFVSGWLEYVREDVENFFYSFGDLGKAWYDFWSGDYLEETGGKIYDFFHKTLPEYCRTGWNEILAFFRKKWQEHQDNFNAGCDSILQSFRDTWNGITTFFRKKWQEHQDNFNSGCDSIGKFFRNAWNGITGFFRDTWSEFQDNFRIGCDTVTNFLKDKSQAAWTGIKNTFSAAGGFFSDLWSSIKKPFEDIGDWFHEKFSDAWQRVLDVFSKGGVAFQGIQDGISGVFKETVNHLIDGINNTICLPFNSINGILWNLRNWSFMEITPFTWLPELSIPQIPKLAKGGLVSQPTLAMVGDNPNARNDPEVISPLSKLQAMLPEEGQDMSLLSAKLDTLIQLTEMLVDLVGEIDPCLVLGDKDVYTACERGRRKFQKMKGV